MSRSGFLFAIPLLAVLTVCFTAPLLLMLSWSVHDPPFTLRHYGQLLESSIYIKVLWTTVRIALTRVR